MAAMTGMAKFPKGATERYRLHLTTTAYPPSAHADAQDQFDFVCNQSVPRP